MSNIAPDMPLFVDAWKTDLNEVHGHRTYAVSALIDHCHRAGYEHGLIGYLVNEAAQIALLESNTTQTEQNT